MSEARAQAEATWGLELNAGPPTIDNDPGSLRHNLEPRPQVARSIKARRGKSERVGQGYDLGTATMQE